MSNIACRHAHPHVALPFQSGMRQAASIFALVVAGGFALLAPQPAHSAPAPTVTELTVTNSHNQHVTQVNYTSAPPANLINLNAIVKSNVGAQIVLGTVEFCEVEGTHCRAIGTVPVTGLVQLLNVGATMTIAPTFGTHTYRAVYVGIDYATGPCTSGCSPSTSGSVTIEVVGPPPPGATSTTLTSGGTPGNYTLNAAISGVGAGNGWGAGFDVPITGHADFLDTTNGNFNFGPAAVGPTTFTSGFVTPALTLPPQPPPFSFMLGAVANTKTGLNNSNGPLYNDGSPDLIFVTTNPNPPGNYVIETFLNQLKNGGPTFGTIGPIITPMPAGLSPTANPLAMVVGDFNNDEKADVVISFDDGSVILFSGTGPGFVGTPVFLQSSGLPVVTSMFVADLAHSGYQSIFGVSPLGMVLFQNGPIGIQTGGGTYLSLYTGWDWTASVAAGNFTDLTDDHTEVVVTNPDSQSITVFLGTGTGQFGAPENYPVGNGPSAIAVADFNGDGHLDLAIVNSLDNTVTILLGAGDGTFTLAATLPVGNDPLYIATGDVNGDGVPDLAVGNQGDGTITVLLGVGNGSFTLSPASPLLSTSNGDLLGGVLAADFNTDHFTDIEAVNSLIPNLFIAQLTANTSASVTGVSPIGGGTHQLQAAYSGDTHYQPSTSSTVGLTAKLVVTSLHLAALPASPSQWGQQLMLSATLSPYLAQGNTTNTESITFYNGNTSLGTGVLSNGVATLNINSPSVGTHTLKATYPGDSGFLGSSSTIPFTVNRAASSTLLSAASNHPQVGVADLLTATVTGFSAPRGLVDFKLGNTVFCSVPLGANGKAACPWVPWTTNTATLVAIYEGDPLYAGSTSPALHLTATEVFDQRVVLTVNNTHLTYPGETETKTCVSPRFGGTPTGSVEIFDDFTVLQTLPLGGDGCAYWYINPGLHAGTHYLRAFYSGDPHNPSGYSAIVVVTVSQLPTYWSVQCPQNIQHGQNLQCSVSIWSNLGPPPGSIDYSYDGGPVQSIHIGGGNLSFLIPDPKVGSHTIVLDYPGSTDFAPIPAQTEDFTVSH